MAGILRLRGATSGYSQLQAPAVAGDQTFTFPALGGTLLTTTNPAPLLTLESGTVTAPSLTFEGDSDTGIYSPAGDTLAITTSGVERFRVTSSGTVGIGTDALEANLQVLTTVNNTIESAKVASFGAKGTSNSVRQLNLYAPGPDSNRVAKIAVENSASPFAIDVNGLERLRVTSSGRLGIGTTNPATTLDVDGSIYFSSRLRSTSGGTAANPSIQPGNDADTGIYHPSGTNVIGFSTFGQERVRITSSGTVGIGTTDPDAILTIGEFTGPTTLIRMRSSSGQVQGLDMGPQSDPDAGRVRYYLNDDSIRIFTESAQRARFDSDGLKFGTDSNAANGLNDYEEGVWSPSPRINSAVLGGVTNPTVGTVTATGTYTKIGNICHVESLIDFDASSLVPQSGDRCIIDGLPYQPRSASIGVRAAGTSFVYNAIANGRFAMGAGTVNADDTIDMLIHTRVGTVNYGHRVTLQVSFEVD